MGRLSDYLELELVLFSRDLVSMRLIIGANLITTEPVKILRLQRVRREILLKRVQEKTLNAGYGRYFRFKWLRL